MHGTVYEVSKCPTVRDGDSEQLIVMDARRRKVYSLQELLAEDSLSLELGLGVGVVAGQGSR